MLGNYSNVLQRTQLVGESHSLNRAAVMGKPVAAHPAYQPGRRAEKRVLLSDFGHQSQTSEVVTQARKDFRIQFVAKAAKFRQRMTLDVGVVPVLPDIPLG